MAGLKIVLADEHKMFVEGLKSSLENHYALQLKVSATLNSGKDLIEYIEKEDVAIVICEINFPGMDPPNLIESIKKASKKTKLIVLSAYGDSKLVKSCFKNGADGFMLKSSKIKNLIDCINAVMRDQVYMGEDIKVAPELNNNGNDLKKKRYPVDRFLVRQKMTKRELEVLDLICSGHSNKKISELLFISEHTATVHRKHILKKTGVANSQELVEFVREYKIL
jgi:DNA-binding NarL/FixJ family response regulator